MKQRYEEVRALFGQRQYPQALQSLQLLLWEFSDNQDLLYSKALALEALQRYAEALEVCEIALARADTDRFHALHGRTGARLEAAKAAPPREPIDPVKLLEQLKADTPQENPLAFFNNRFAYLIVFMMLFLMLVAVGPLVYWHFFGLRLP
ncbi:MAG: hypothetical protein HYV26_06190 [Candidatus Hydrogenedentes bacterium]|nr:hypothetical protein [Candidatus Hydrogenedentota bacterium]